jgi:glycosyltransferase involved in cell wall biosynthesis
MIPRSDSVFVHFAGWNSLLPLLVARLFGKRSVLFLHGTDSVSLPSIGYGNFRKQPLAALSCWSLRLARRVVAVDEALLSSVNVYATGTPLPQGVKAFCSGLQTPMAVLPHGFDPKRWPMGFPARDIDVLTVAVDLGQAWRRSLKGIDLLIEVAHRMPERRFVVVGLPPDILQLPANLEAHTYVPSQELAAWYQRAKVYVQTSMSEGFGCALAEAMLCGCVPVVSRVGAMPSIIGDTGEVVEQRSGDALQEAVQRALVRSERNDAGTASRARITSAYPLDARRRGLRALL